MSDYPTRPADFQRFWDATLAELARFPQRPEMEPIPLRSTDFAALYGVRLTSAGPYRLFAYLSVPKGPGPFPAIYHLPGYASVVAPIPQGTANLVRSRFVTLSLAVRGQRNADKPFAAMFPGLLTEGINNHSSYIFRAIAADCVRGLEFLLSRPEEEVDATRIVARGNDMALLTAALHPRVTHLVFAPQLFFGTSELAQRTREYPLAEVSDYLRLYPSRKAAVEKTLSYYDLRWFAPDVRASTLVLAGPEGSLLDGRALRSLVRAFPGEAAVHDSESSTYKDGLFAEQWLAGQLGYDAPILPGALAVVLLLRFFFSGE